MNLRNVFTVFRKEVRDMLRDKRTIRSMVIIPVVAFPLLFMIIGWAAEKFSGEAGKEASPVMIHGGQDSPKILNALGQFPAIRIEPYASDARQQVSDKTIRAVVEIPDGFDASIAAGQPEKVSIEYYEADMKSELAKEKLQKFFDDYRVHIAAQALAARGLPTTLLEPFTVEPENIAPPSKVGAAMFGGLIPYLIIIFCFTGAMYPAMDLTAGEKERGTLETVLSSPVSRTDLVLGKFFTVMLFSIITALLSLLSLGLTFAETKGKAFSGGREMPQFSIDPAAVGAVIVMLLPIAVLFAALLLAVALFAKSYREAQTYVSPLVFVVIAPAIIGTLPGVELNAKTALVPILNTCLVSKELLAGNHPWGLMAAVFGTTCIYAAVGIAAAVHLFNRENVLFRV
jgi:sodium transport system permease protein